MRVGSKHVHHTSFPIFVRLLIILCLSKFNKYHFSLGFSTTTSCFFKTHGRNFMTIKNNEGSSNTDSVSGIKKDNKAMAFLRKIGRVSNNNDFTNAIGVDEGIAGKESSGSGTIRKSTSAYRECTDSDGIIDDVTDTFPFTSSGNQWYGLTDSSFGGKSAGSLTRESYEGKTANVLRGKVVVARQKQQEDDESFIQMATNLALNNAAFSTVDASKYSGIKVVVFYDGSKELEDFNIHFRTPACRAQMSCYRASFELEKGNWKTIQIPWNDFIGVGPGPSKTVFENSSLRRVSIVALGEKPDFTLAVSRVGFY